MKILHTADLHLKGYGDDRWESLRRLVEVGKKERIESLVISGDLFDKGIDAENLRARIREIFSSTGFKIVIIPGNHDKDAYKRGMWFGEDVIVLTELNTPFEHKGVRIWGMPFEPIEGEEILQRLRWLANSLTNATSNILLYHGELLDAFFSRRDFGDEGEERYMPVKLSYFKDLEIDYVLAGHFHSRMNFWKLENGGYFVYPGSPVSITKREIGRRHVNIFEIGKPPREYPLGTSHFEDVVIEFNPFSDNKPIETVKEGLDGLHKEARVILTLKGFLNGKAIGMDERELVEKIKTITEKRDIEGRYEFMDIQVILEDDLFKRFGERLEQTGYDEEEKKQIREFAIHAMIKSRR